MRRFGCIQSTGIIVSSVLFLLLPACGGHKPPGSNPFPAKITLNPALSASMQLGTTMVFTAIAQNDVNGNISPAFTYSLTPDSPSGILDISPAGFACAGSWNAPYYNVCTAAGTGTVQVVASALGATSPPTLVFVHPAIDNIQISIVPPVNPPPAACPTQTALPAACDIAFNASAANYCVSQNQMQTLQATAYSNGVDITASVGPFTWSQANPSVVKITPTVTSSENVPTNQATVVSNNPGLTQVVASASGVSSQPYIAETCPVQCISLQVGSNIGETSFLTNKGTAQSITATVVDVQGCIVPKPPLTWTSSAPAALAAGSATIGCTAANTCAISTAQPGAAAITASCSPPTCNIGFPLVPTGLPALYVPQPVYPVTSISGLVTGVPVASSVLAASQDCYSNSLCTVALYDVSTTKNIASSPSSMPTPPNSIMFDPAGDKAYAGSQYGSLLITVANLGSTSSSPFTALPATGTTLGLVTGKVIAVSPSGGLAVFSDTVSTPNQVYVVNTGSSSPSTIAENINSATTATFSPDNSKAFILGNGGNTLYVYSTLQALQTIPLTASANTVAFSSTGAFAFIAGASSTANIDVLNTCNNSPATMPGGAALSITGLPATPLFLKMVPPGNAPTGNNVIPNLQQSAFDNLDVFFGLDNTGIDVIATTTTTPVTTTPATPLCPQQQITLAQTTQNTTFNPIHIDLQKGTFHPINFFLSPGGDQVYIVTSDQGVLVYNFGTQSVSAIPINGGAAPVAADMTVDGTLMYVAGTDGVLHELNTALAMDVMEIPFSQLPNSSNNFCYDNYTCALNLVAIKP
ncbi:MAG: WD40 repeat domain-containing protein [Candidatus Sulfotelmatobacter sp.]